MTKRILSIFIALVLMFFLGPTQKVSAESKNDAAITAAIIIYAQCTYTIIKALRNYDALTTTTILGNKKCHEETFNSENSLVKLSICPFSLSYAEGINGEKIAGFIISDETVFVNGIRMDYYSLKAVYSKKENGEIITEMREILFYLDSSNTLIMEPDSFKMRILIASLLESLANFND